MYKKKIDRISKFFRHLFPKSWMQPSLHDFESIEKRTPSHRSVAAKDIDFEIEYTLETEVLLSPMSLEDERGGESLEELRAIIRRTTFIPEARIVATVTHYMKRYGLNEMDAIRRILSDRENER